MRCPLLPTLVLLAGLAAPTTTAVAQTPPSGAHGAPAQPAAAADGDQALIANALSAAPASVAATATVMNHDGRLLRKGSTDWVCMPDLPDVPNNTPMCLDAPWRSFMDAFRNGRAPSVTQVGFGYMLQGDMPVSNTDPSATGPTATNDWIQDGVPHVMVLLPDAKLLDSLSTDPHNGGPWVMWKGTPYAHVMIPASPPR